MRDLAVRTSESFESKSDVSQEFLREIILKACKRCWKIDKLRRPLMVEFEPIENSYVLEKMNGVHGRTRNAEKMEFNLSTKPDNWKPFLKAQFAHEYGHTVFIDPLGLKYESNIENWRHVLLEAHGQHFAEKVYPEIRPAWRTKFTENELSEKWPKIKPKMGTKIFTESIFKSGEFHPWLGYSLAYYIGQELLKQHNLDELPALEKEKIIEAGDQIFK